MDREISTHRLSQRAYRRGFAWLAATTALVLSILALRSWILPSIDRDEIRTARVELGEVVASISAAGQVVPMEEQVVSALFDSEIVEVMAASCPRQAGPRKQRLRYNRRGVSHLRVLLRTMSGLAIASLSMA